MRHALSAGMLVMAADTVHHVCLTLTTMLPSSSFAEARSRHKTCTAPCGDANDR